MEKTIELAKEDHHGLIFVNLVDFDAVYGHRRNAIGYGDAIEEFDAQLSDLMAAINDDDLIMITADHGNDPTWKGTDHAASLEPDGVRKLVRDCRAVAKALTYKSKDVLDIEEIQRNKLKKNQVKW